jgi:hypothetical protein
MTRLPDHKMQMKEGLGICPELARECLMLYIQMIQVMQLWRIEYIKRWGSISNNKKFDPVHRLL